jgi:LPXTG-motif cell wall-anchored protein
VVTNTLKTTKSAKTSNQMNWIIGIGTPVGALSLLFLFLLLRKRKKAVVSENESSQDNQNGCRTSLIQTEQVDYWKETESSLNDSNQFAVFLPKAIIQKIEEKWCFTCSSREKAFEKIQDNNPEIALRLRTIVDECDLFRYGFGANEIDTNALFDEAKHLIDRLS